MNLSQFFQLLFIAAIWGGSHVFVRFSVPVLGPALVSWGRVTIAAIAMAIYLKGIQKKWNLVSQFKIFLVIGFLNAALPFFLFAYASQVLPASYLVVLNSMNPVFTALFSSLFLKEAFGVKKFMSLLLGITGVFLMKEYGSVEKVTLQVVIAFAAGLTAAASYALCGIYVKKNANQIPSEILTAGTYGIASFLLLPLLAAEWTGGMGLLPHSEKWLSATLCVVALGLFCSALAFLFYYRLLQQLGPFRSSLVTFLMPLFGILWGVVFLGETVRAGMLVGAAFIVLATSFFLKKTPKIKEMQIRSK